MAHDDALGGGVKSWRAGVIPDRFHSVDHGPRVARQFAENLGVRASTRGVFPLRCQRRLFSDDS